MKKNLIVSFIVLFALVLAWFIYQQFRGADAKHLEIYGNIDIRQFNLGFRVGGRIQEMRWEEGDSVKAGNTIALLDQGPYEDQVDIARAQFAQSEANYRKMVNGFRVEEIDQARAQVAQMRANVTNAELKDRAR